MNLAERRENLPPMLTQYLEYKEKYPDCQLLFQVGDFYELFFDDAVVVAQTLNLTLTSRDKNSPNPIPMCGVPIAVVDSYLERLVDAGFSVAVVSQDSGPKSGKGAVTRSLERIVTPGIRLLSGAESEVTAENIASVYYQSSDEIAVAFTEVQSGLVQVRDSLSSSQLLLELQRVAPLELVLPAAVEGRSITRRFAWIKEIEHYFKGASIKFRAADFTEGAFSAERDFAGLPGYTALSPTARKAVRLLVNFVDETTVSSTVSISQIVPKSYDKVMEIDATTRRNLELVRNVKQGGREGTLLHFMDRTCTAGGERLLKRSILAPLNDRREVELRLECVEHLREDREQRTVLRESLKRTADLERIAARLDLGIVTPRELGALRDSLQSVDGLRQAIESLEQNRSRSQLVEVERLELLQRILDGLKAPPGILERLEGALVDNPPLVASEGGIFVDEFSEDLKRLRSIRARGKSWINEMALMERERTGINSLKIKFNNVLGYFIEVTKANLGKVPENYVRRQSMVNADRFITEELKQREEELLSAKEKQIELEKGYFENLKQEVSNQCSSLRALHAQIALLDLLTSLADLAESEDLVRPDIVDNTDLQIEAGRHPIVAQLLRGRFVPNSLRFHAKGKNFVIITGPNMGGKSTYLRQAALIAIMGQIGSFVPAQSAKIGLVDKIFARLGATDDLAEGESTFMVEMREVSHIISHSTERSLVLIDEVGRGTATADGLSIARAILEWIIGEIGCRTLFATHFHELTVLEDTLGDIVNLSVGSVDNAGEVIFTHEIRPGPASRSYGIEVARLAGLPKPLLKRAQNLLIEREQVAAGRGLEIEQQLSIFDLSASEPEAEPSSESGTALESELNSVRDRLRELDLDQITPLEALNHLSILKREVLED